jgi:hypothetical protein
LNLAKQLIHHPNSPDGIDWLVLERAVDMANALQQSDDFEDWLRGSELFSTAGRRPTSIIRRTVQELRRMGLNLLSHEIETVRPIA